MIHTPISYQPIISNSSIHFDLCRLIYATTIALLGFNDRFPGLTYPYPQLPSRFSYVSLFVWPLNNNLKSCALFTQSSSTVPEVVKLEFTEGDIKSGPKNGGFRK